MRFTELQIKNLKGAPTRYDLREKNGRGFGLRVSPTGKKIWIFLYSYEGKKKRLTLGEYPYITLSEARKKHAEAIIVLKEGKDPALEKSRAKSDSLKSPTVELLINEYMEKWAMPRKKDWKKDEQRLKKDVLPTIGKMKAKDVTRRDIILLLEKAMERGLKVGANRLLAVIRRMFNFAVERAILPFSPCAGIKALAKEVRKTRFLSEEEIKEFWHKFEGPDSIELILKFMLITAQRKGEVLTMEWCDLELDNGWWNLPPEKTKNGLENRVPLSDLALEILKSIQNKNTKYVFPSTHGDKPIEASSPPRILKENLSGPLKDLKPFTPHDLRRTASTHIGALGISRFIVKKILNHVDSTVTGTYDRHKYNEKKKKALDKWANKLKEIIGD